MLASEFINFFLSQSAVSVDRTKILSNANWVQNKIAGMDTEFLRILPDPYFLTTDATYTYVANDVCRAATSDTPGDSVGDVRVIREIYNNSDRNSWSSDFGRNPFPRYAWGEGGRRWRAPITCPGSNVPETDDCLVYWDLNNNPGTQTTLYRARAYRWPTQMLSESADTYLTIPDDFAFDLLYEAVKALIEDSAYGRADYPLGMENVHMKRFRTKYSAPTIYGRIQNSPPLNA